MATQELALTEDQLSLIKRTVAKDATNDELKLFFYDCQRRNVHPLDKLIHFTKRQGKYTPITSIDFMRIRAAESGEYAGSDDPLFEELPAPAKNPAKASVTVYRMVDHQRCAFTATARWAEYAPSDMSDKSAFMWRKMPFTMIGKCAEALALRKAFPGQLQGLYAKEEMDQANGHERMEPGQAKAYAAEQIAKLPPKREEEAPLYELAPEENEARFVVTRVESLISKTKSPYRVLWCGETGHACWEKAEFETIDRLSSGDTVTVGLKRKGDYLNIIKITDVKKEQEDSLFVSEDDYAAS